MILSKTKELNAQAPVTKNNFSRRELLLRIDKFLGHLKKPFAPKPGFFIHDLLFILLFAKEILNLWYEGKALFFDFVAISNNVIGPDTGFVVAMVLNNIIPFLVGIFILVQLWKFLRKTKFSWIIFTAISWSPLFVLIFTVITQYIAFTSIGVDVKFKFNAVAYILYFLPWLFFHAIVIFLLARKKIRVMHKIKRKHLFLSPLYGLLWAIAMQLITRVIFLAYNIFS